MSSMLSGNLNVRNHARYSEWREYIDQNIDRPEWAAVPFSKWLAATYPSEYWRVRASNPAAPAPLAEGHEWHAMVERIRQRHACRYEGISTPNEARMSDINHLLKYIERQAATAAPASVSHSDERPVAAITDEQIECAALEHVAPGWKQLAAVLGKQDDYRQTEQFRRLKDFVHALAVVPAAAPIVQPDDRLADMLRAKIEALPRYYASNMIGETLEEDPYGDVLDRDAVLAALAAVPAAAPIAQPVGEKWRKLAMQFDGQRMQAMWHLKAMLHDPEAHRPRVEEFLAAAPSVQAEPVHVIDAAMSLLRVAQTLDVNRITPARLRQQVIESVDIAKGAEGEGEEYIYADVYGHLVEMIQPYVPGGERPEDHPFTASVTDTMELLIEHWKRTSAAPTTSTADAKDAAKVLKKAQAVIEAFESLTVGCIDKSWSSWENGNGTNVGRNIEAALKSYRAAIATSADEVKS